MKIEGALSGRRMFGKSIADDKQKPLNYLLDVRGVREVKVVAGEVHDPCVVTYQTLEANQLNRSLKACGVSDPSKRREMIEHFLFNSGYFRDSCWFEEDGRQFRPIVCFEEVGLDGESKDRLFVPDPSFGTSFHEYAHGAAAWIFEHGEDASEIKTGDVSQ